jgi:WD40 repeat protein
MLNSLVKLTFAEPKCNNQERNDQVIHVALEHLLSQKLSTSTLRSQLMVYPEKPSKEIHISEKAIINFVLALSENIFAASMPKQVEIWDFSTSRKLHTIPTTNSWELQLLDESTLVIGCRYELIFFNWKTCTIINTLPLDVEQLSTEGHPIFSIFGPWKQFVVIALQDSSVFEIWDINCKILLKRLRVHDLFKVTGVLAVDNTLLVTSAGNELQLWNLQTWTSIIKRDMAHLQGRQIISLCLDTRRAKLISANVQGGIRIWNVHTLDFIREIWRGGPLILIPVHIISLSPDHIAVACGKDMFCRIWDISTGKILRKYLVEGAALSVAFLEWNQTVIACSLGSIKSWRSK